MYLCVVGVRAWLLRAEATSKLHSEFKNYVVQTHRQVERGSAYANFPTRCSHWCTAVALKDCHWELIMWPNQLQVYQMRVKAGRGGNPLWCQQRWICNANFNRSCYYVEHFCCMCRSGRTTGDEECVCACVCLCLCRRKKKEKKNIIPIQYQAPHIQFAYYPVYNIAQQWPSTWIPWWIILFLTSY